MTLPTPTLQHQIEDLVRACFSGIWIESHEHPEALAELGQLCREQDWRIATWDIDRGLTTDQQATPEGSIPSAADPLAAVRSLESLADQRGTTLLVLQNFHRFLNSPEIIQAVSRAVIDGKVRRTIVVILSPVVQLPIELEKRFVVVEHHRPDRTQIEQIARSLATEAGELPGDDELPALLDAAAGLTRQEVENAFSLALVRHGRLEPGTVWELKTQTLKKSELITLHQGDEGFDQLGGLNTLKAFTRRALLRRGTGQAREGVQGGARGVLLLSPPGCGKSAFCKALGKEVGRPVLILDVGTLMGSLVGQSEERTREALRIIDAMAPAVVMIDEVEKAFAGVAGSQGDSGVASRMFGTFLSWLSDHQSDVFVVCTANDVSRLPPEFSRAERFDGVFFMDLPDRAQKDAIWELYRDQYRLPPSSELPDDQQWTGAEIKSCCRLAALLDLPLVAAAQNIVPIAQTAAESVQRLREWANGRCLSADRPGVYRSAEVSRRRAASLN